MEKLMKAEANAWNLEEKQTSNNANGADGRRRKKSGSTVALSDDAGASGDRDGGNRRGNGLGQSRAHERASRRRASGDRRRAGSVGRDDAHSRRRGGGDAGLARSPRDGLLGRRRNGGALAATLLRLDGHYLSAGGTGHNVGLDAHGLVDGDGGVGDKGESRRSQSGRGQKERRELHGWYERVKMPEKKRLW